MVDTHCHLEHLAIGEVLGRARDAGVNRMASVGMNAESIERTLGIADENADVIAIIGRHPHETTGWQDGDIEAIEAAARDPNVRAIGETGLDYFRDRAPRADQRRAFEAQIELAERLGLPLVIHTRDAIDDTLEALSGAETTVVMHCFSSPERLDACVERGYMCSFAGNVTYPKAEDLQGAARAVPDELLLVETDSPYLSPQPVRGKRNEPANVVLTAQFLAQLRGEDYEQLERIIEDNARRVFAW